MTKKLKISLIIILGLILLTFIYVERIFFFNPLTFRQDHITYLPWNWYKQLMHLDYMVYDGNKYKMYKVSDTEEVHFVFEQLKESSIIYSQPVKKDSFEEIIIRNDNGDGILLDIHTYGDNILMLKHNNKIIMPTKQLSELLKKRFSQVK